MDKKGGGPPVGTIRAFLKGGEKKGMDKKGGEA